MYSQTLLAVSSPYWRRSRVLDSSEQCKKCQQEPRWWFLLDYFWFLGSSYRIHHTHRRMLCSLYSCYQPDSWMMGTECIHSHLQMQHLWKQWILNYEYYEFHGLTVAVCDGHMILTYVHSDFLEDKWSAAASKWMCQRGVRHVTEYLKRLAEHLDSTPHYRVCCIQYCNRCSHTFWRYWINFKPPESNVGWRLETAGCFIYDLLITRSTCI